MTIKPQYPVVLRPLSVADGGGWVVIVPDLPGCMSDGATSYDALENAENAIEEWKEAATSLGRAIPHPDDSLRRSFDELVPAHIQRLAEEYASKMFADRPGGVDPSVLHALIAEWAKAAAERVKL